MTDHRIIALRGTDPHAFLAAVGLLLHSGDGATLRFEGATPVIDTEASADDVVASLLADCRLGEGHLLEGEWCRTTASREGWENVGARRSWDEHRSPDGRGSPGTPTAFGPSWARMVWPAEWNGAALRVTGLWLYTASGKIGVCTQMKRLVPIDGRPGEVPTEKLVADVEALFTGRHPTPYGATILGLGASRAKACHAVELLTLVGGLLQPPGTRTPSGERGLTWCLWDVPLTAAEVYPVLRSPSRWDWPVFSSPIVSPPTGNKGKLYGPTVTWQASGLAPVVRREVGE